MPFDWGTALGSGALTTVTAALVGAVVQRRKLGADVGKTEADAAKVVTEIALDMVKPLSERIHKLQDEVDQVRRQLREAADELVACHDSIRAKDAHIREQQEELALLRSQGRAP